MATKATMHAACGDGTLCGSNSLTACVNSSTCVRCNNRMDKILALLLDAADGQDVKARAARMVADLRVERNPEVSA